MNLPNLDDPDNWMALTAIAALVLSQLPPVLPRIWGFVRGGTVLVTSQDSFGLTHHLGRAFLILPVQIENTGSIPVTVASIDCVVRRLGTGADSDVWRMPARTYYADSTQSWQGGGPSRLFIGAIHLKPGETWQEVVHCYKPSSLDDEEKAQELQDEIADYIYRKLRERREAGDDDRRLVEVDEKLVDDARDFANRMFGLTKGEYELYVSASDRGGGLLGVAKYQFILYENMIRSLRSISEEYQYGFGVSEGPPPHKRTLIEPRLTPVISEEQARRDYEGLPSH